MPEIPTAKEKGKAMTDEQLKKLALAQLILDQMKYFRSEIEDRDGDDIYCCDGKMCGCGGMTNRDHWKLLAGIE